MPDDNRFFRYLWRFNATALAVASVVVLGTIGWNILSYWFVRPAAESPPAGHFAPVPKTAEREFTYRLETNPAVSGVGNEQFFTLKRWRGEPSVYGLQDIQRQPYVSSPSASVTDDSAQDVNLLAVDARNASSHWLFRGYQRSLLSEGAVYGARPESPPDASAPAIAMTVVAVAADTNGDGTLNQRDRQSLYVYRPGDEGAVKLLEADFFLATGQLDNFRYLVVYEQGATATAAIYSVPDFKLLSQGPLPSVPQ